MAETTTHIRRNHNIIATSELPTDIILHHIAPRLPVKSVFRLMTASKEFHSFLNTQNFTKVHLHHVTNDHRQNHDKILVLSMTKPLFTTISPRWFSHKAPDDRLTPPNRPLSFHAAVGFTPENMFIVASFHGLVCIGTHSLGWKYYSNLVLWNPATGDYKILSKTDFIVACHHYHQFTLYYSACDDNYKLVLVTNIAEVYMYSLKSDSWRNLIDSTNELIQDTRLINEVTMFKENIYILVGSPFSLLRFDIKTEKLTQIKPPNLARHNCWFENARLIFHKGRIHLCVRCKNSNVKYETWRMNRDGDWSNVDPYSVPEDLSWKKIHNQLLCMFGSVSLRRYTPTLVSPNQYMNP